MEADRKHIEHLEQQIAALAEAQRQLANSQDLKEMIRIIHFPGWTTPAEFSLVSSAIEQLHAQLVLLTRAQADLLTNSKKVVPRG